MDGLRRTSRPIYKQPLRSRGDFEVADDAWLGHAAGSPVRAVRERP